MRRRAGATGVGRRMTAGDEEAGENISELLAALRERLEGERVSLQDIADATGRRGHGLLLLILAIPETIPMVGLSAVLATPIFLLGLLMTWHGADVPIPGFIGRRTVRRSLLERGIDRALPVLRRVERVLRPRWTTLARAGRLQGVACVLMAILLALPIPGVNFLGAAAVAAIGLGILERDGRAVAVGLASGTLAIGGFVAALLGVEALLGGLL